MNDKWLALTARIWIASCLVGRRLSTGLSTVLRLGGLQSPWNSLRDLSAFSRIEIWRGPYPSSPMMAYSDLFEVLLDA